MQALLITGETYPLRRELRAAGCIWKRDRMGYLIQGDELPAHLAALVQNGKLCVDTVDDVTEDELAPLTGEALRAYRQDRQDRRAARLVDRAEVHARRAQEARDRIQPHERDFLSLFEPVKAGHHSEGRHRKLIAKAQRSFEDAGREAHEAAQLRRQAESLQPAAVAGDAEARRQAVREKRTAEIGIGDRVSDPMFGTGVVMRCNAKTFTVQYADRGFVQKIDKSWASLVAKGGAENIAPPKFKTGDLVTVRRLAGKWPGQILRRTSRGYSVEYETETQLAGKTTHRDTFSEGDITMRAFVAEHTSDGA